MASREVSKPRDWLSNFLIALKFNERFGSSDTKAPVKFLNDRTNLNSNLTASRFREIWWNDIRSLVSRGTGKPAPATPKCNGSIRLSSN